MATGPMNCLYLSGMTQGRLQAGRIACNIHRANRGPLVYIHHGDGNCPEARDSEIRRGSANVSGPE